MTRCWKILACALLLSVVGACATINEVPPAKKHTIGGILSVEAARSWNAMKTDRGELWTLNGFALDRMAFITKVADGEPVYKRASGQHPPTFRAGMTATDIVDLYEAMLTSSGYSQIDVGNLHPASVSGQDAFRFDYTAFNNDGLAKRGIVLGFIDSEKGLNLVLYEAAAEHYYEASLGEAEKVLASLQKI